MADIAIEGATKVYSDGAEAVASLDLDIADGEFVVLVGSSGCGKTTALGSEVLAHFTVDAPPVVTDDTKELVRDLGTTAQLEARAAEGTSSFVARLDPRTPARRGEPLEMAVDVLRMHFFDLDDGRSIFDD